MSAGQPEDRRAPRTATGLRAVSDANALVGRTFGDRYRVEGVIGRGGMSVVYRAHDRQSGGPIALKIMSQSVAEDERQTLRFKQEARASSRLNHPSIVRVVDYGQAPDGLLYMAMELLEGRTLGQLVKQDGPLAPARACRIMADACRALAEAHKLGIIHRDLKPDNVFIVGARPGASSTGRDVVKLLDFGIAKVVGEGNYETLTQTGFICGTPLYISPEQSLGQELDGRSDLYSAGVILFELLTGKTPFMADTPIALVMKHIHNEPPTLESQNPGVQVMEGLRAVIFRLLSKDRNKRSRSAQEVAETLEKLAPGSSTTAAPPPPGWLPAAGSVPVARAVEASPEPASPPAVATDPDHQAHLGNELPNGPVIKPSRTASRVALRPVAAPLVDDEGYESTRMLDLRSVDTSPVSQPLQKPRKAVEAEGRRLFWASIGLAAVLAAGLTWLVISLNSGQSKSSEARAEPTRAPANAGAVASGASEPGSPPAEGASAAGAAPEVSPPKADGPAVAPSPRPVAAPPELAAVPPSRPAEPPRPTVAVAPSAPLAAGAAQPAVEVTPPVAVAIVPPPREDEDGEARQRRDVVTAVAVKKKPKGVKVQWKE